MIDWITIYFATIIIPYAFFLLGCEIGISNTHKAASKKIRDEEKEEESKRLVLTQNKNVILKVSSFPTFGEPPNLITKYYYKI
jgi:hypothetical protein